METLCAFLNRNGGTVLFGVTDKGKIICQEVSDKTKRDIAEPEFQIAADEVKIIFRRKPTGQVAGQVTGQPTGQVVSLIRCIGDQTLSVKEIMSQLSLKGRDNFLKSYLYPAIQDELVEQTHPEQANHPNQKYRLTDSGKRLQEQESKKD